jgi:RNA polymerase sigma factor (TIGR02999 family)
VDSAITELLLAARRGDTGAHGELFSAVYDELRSLARRHMRRTGAGDTLQTTALVHEAYLRLCDPGRVSIGDRGHFFALASRVMRQVLVDHFRRRDTDKRGGGWNRLSLDDAEIPVAERGPAVLALDAALERLSRVEERLARVVEYRFFGGMTEKEIADHLGVSERTVRNDWMKARLWLIAELAPG